MPAQSVPDRYGRVSAAPLTEGGRAVLVIVLETQANGTWTGLHHRYQRRAERYLDTSKQCQSVKLVTWLLCTQCFYTSIHHYLSPELNLMFHLDGEGP